MFASRSDPNETGIGRGGNTVTTFATSTPFSRASNQFDFDADRRSAGGRYPPRSFEGSGPTIELGDYTSMVDQLRSLNTRGEADPPVPQRTWDALTPMVPFSRAEPRWNRGFNPSANPNDGYGDREPNQLTTLARRNPREEGGPYQDRYEPSPRKGVPIAKWRLKKFDGKEEEWMRFIITVNQYALAEGATEADLLRNRIYLFAGDAADFLAINQNFQTWEQLIHEMTRWIRGSNSDYERLRQIERKRQGPRESSGLYLLRMEILFRSTTQYPSRTSETSSCGASGPRFDRP